VSAVGSCFGVHPVKERWRSREERQASPVEDPVSALIAVTRPIINGVAQSIGGEYIEAYDDRTVIPLKMLGRLRKEHDGDIGLAFEDAIHEGVQRTQPVVVERVTEALKLCNIRRGDAASILFAIEKQGAKQLIFTEMGLITDNSRALSGNRGQPVKLKKHLNQLAAAFRRSNTKLNLPQSISCGEPTHHPVAVTVTAEWRTDPTAYGPDQAWPDRAAAGGHRAAARRAADSLSFGLRANQDPSAGASLSTVSGSGYDRSRTYRRGGRD
jgi:hypothetical protein